MNKFFIRAVLGLCSILVIAGCSRLDLAVSWADTYIASKVDDYFDLNSEQSKELKLALKTDIGNIRKEQFPKWASVLRDFEKDIQTDNLSEEKFRQYFQQTLEVSQQLQPLFADTAVRFISRANPQQLKHFEKVLRKKNIEDEQKIQNREKTRNEARKKYLRGIEMWVESLSKDQNQLLNRHLSENPFPAQALAKNRHKVLEQFIEAQKSPESLTSFVRNYYTDKTQYAAPEYQQALRAYQGRLQGFVFQLLQSLSEKQKNALRTNLSEKATLLEKLAAKGP